MLGGFKLSHLLLTLSALKLLILLFPLAFGQWHILDLYIFWRVTRRWYMTHYPSCFKSKEHPECPFVVNLA